MAKKTPYYIEVEVDLLVGPMPITDKNRQIVSAIIAKYKLTGEIIKSIPKSRVMPKKKILFRKK